MVEPVARKRGPVQGGGRAGGELSGLFVPFTQPFLVHMGGKVLARVDGQIQNMV